MKTQKKNHHGHGDPNVRGTGDEGREGRVHSEAVESRVLLHPAALTECGDGGARVDHGR
jgi:hypothetical protein